MEEIYKNILLISDLEIDKNIISNPLENAGYEVFYVNSSKCHSKYIKNVYLTIVDCRKGLDLLNSIVNKENVEVAIIALIDDIHGMRESIFSSGAWDYIISPIIVRELLVRVKSCLYIYGAKNMREKNNTISLENKNKTHKYKICCTERLSNNDLELVKKTCQYLLINLSLNQSLEELAHKMETNRNRLSKVFKNTLGTGIFSWWREQRMEEAKGLCITTDLSIQKICDQVGYSDLTTFSTAFRKYFDMSPREFRKNHGIQNIQ